jgi:chemotaxis protein CheZ
MSAEQNQAKFNMSEVTAIVNKAITKIGQEQIQKQDKVYEELKSLIKLISGICHNIDAPGDTLHSGKGDITKATAELDEVVKATEKATSEIMDSCERIQAAASGASEEISNEIMNETIKIFESCSFQDITGQRISNAVKALYEIEQRMDKLVELLNIDGSYQISHDAAEDTRDEEEKLKNGPQLPGNEMSQEDIDRLLAE